MQNLNVHRNPEAMIARRKKARRMIRHAIYLIRVMIEVGCDPVWEHPLRATSWQLPEVVKMCEELLTFKSRTDGGCFNMRTSDTGGFNAEPPNRRPAYPKHVRETTATRQSLAETASQQQATIHCPWLSVG